MEEGLGQHLNQSSGEEIATINDDGTLSVEDREYSVEALGKGHWKLSHVEKVHIIHIKILNEADGVDTLPFKLEHTFTGKNNTVTIKATNPLSNKSGFSSIEISDPEDIGKEGGAKSFTVYHDGTIQIADTGSNTFTHLPCCEEGTVCLGDPQGNLRVYITQSNWPV